MAKEHQDKLNHIAEVHDEKRKRQLRMEDDEEDFLDESRSLNMEVGHLIYKQVTQHRSSF